MIAGQIGELASLASQYNIGDIVIAEMQRVNGDQEVRFVVLFIFPEWHHRTINVAVFDAL